MFHSCCTPSTSTKLESISVAGEHLQLQAICLTYKCSLNESYFLRRCQCIFAGPHSSTVALLNKRSVDPRKQMLCRSVLFLSPSIAVPNDTLSSLSVCGVFNDSCLFPSFSYFLKPPSPFLFPPLCKERIDTYFLHFWFCFCKILLRIVLIIFLWRNLVRLKESVLKLLLSLFIFCKKLFYLFYVIEFFFFYFTFFYFIRQLCMYLQCVCWLNHGCLVRICHLDFVNF